MDQRVTQRWLRDKEAEDVSAAESHYLWIPYLWIHLCKSILNCTVVICGHEQNGEKFELLENHAPSSQCMKDIVWTKYTEATRITYSTFRQDWQRLHIPQTRVASRLPGYGLVNKVSWEGCSWMWSCQLSPLSGPAFCQARRVPCLQHEDQFQIRPPVHKFGSWMPRAFSMRGRDGVIRTVWAGGGTEDPDGEKRWDSKYSLYQWLAYCRWWNVELRVERPLGEIAWGKLKQ